jgi:FkbM family methyltransferase
MSRRKKDGRFAGFRAIAVKLRRLVGRGDFVRNPLKALWRRLVWKVRWQFIRRPWVLKLRGGLKIAVARDGLGCLLYYQGFSEPEIEEFLERFLKPGMIFIDVGAHIGKYVLLASPAVGPGGEVHAFEPNPLAFQLLEANVRRNKLSNVFLRSCAVSDREEARDFEICRELTVSSFAKSSVARQVREVVQVRCVDLDSYCVGWRRRPDLVKIDVEGAELAVFQGARRLLDLPAGQSPAWLFEYSPANLGHFGHRPAELLGLLRLHGYGVWRCRLDGRILPFQPAPVKEGTLNLLAIKDGPPPGA